MFFLSFDADDVVVMMYTLVKKSSLLPTLLHVSVVKKEALYIHIFAPLEVIVVHCAQYFLHQKLTGIKSSESF